MTTTFDPPTGWPAALPRPWPDRLSVYHLAAVLDGDTPGAPMVPLVTWLPADLDTPVSAYLKLTGGDTDTGFGFLLESIHGGDHPGRWSFMGVNPTQQLRVDPGVVDPLAALAAQVAAWRVVVAPDAPWPPFIGGAVGYMGYEAVGAFEPVPPAAHDPHGLPLALFGLYDTVVAFDHAFAQMQVISFAALSGDLAATYTAAEERIAAVCARLTGPLPSRQSSVLGRQTAGARGSGSGVRVRSRSAVGSRRSAVGSHHWMRILMVHPLDHPTQIIRNPQSAIRSRTARPPNMKRWCCGRKRISRRAM